MTSGVVTSGIAAGGPSPLSAEIRGHDHATDGPAGSARILRRAVTSDLAVSAATAASRQYGVGTDRRTELLVQRRSADEHDVGVAQALLGERVDDHLHVRHRRRQQRRHAEDVGLVELEGGEELVDVGVDAEVDDLEAGAFEHHRHQVLADVVDVALDGADHDLADRFGSGLGEQRAQDLHPGLHRVGREQHLGHEQDAVAEVDADDPHALDERVVQRPVRAPAAVEQDHRALDDLVGEPVVQVVVHLLDELCVVERGEIDLVGLC